MLEGVDSGAERAAGGGGGASWKFNKNTQAWLLRNMFGEEEVRKNSCILVPVKVTKRCIIFNRMEVFLQVLHVPTLEGITLDTKPVPINSPYSGQYSENCYQSNMAKGKTAMRYI